MEGGDNLNMQNVIGDLKKNIQEKKAELYQIDSNITDYERQLEILDVSIKEKTEVNRDMSTKLAGATSTLESVIKKRDDEMMLHSNLLRKLQTCEDIKKELRSKTHRETLDRLNGHTSIFNQMTEKSKLTKYLEKTGASNGTKDDLNEDIRNKLEQLKEIQASTPLEKYEEVMSDLKSKEHLVEASKELENSISMAQKNELDLDEKIERVKEKIRQMEKSMELETN